MGECTPLGDSAWHLLQLAIEKAWSVLDGPFFCFLAQTIIVNSPFTLYRDFISRQLSVWRSVLWSESPDY